jgi:hypothetical protein
MKFKLNFIGAFTLAFYPQFYFAINFLSDKIKAET